MDGERAFRWGAIAASGLLAVLLLSQYLTVILGAVLLAYLLNPAHRRLAPTIGNGAAAIGLIAATTVLVVVPLILLVTTAVTGLRDLAERLLGEGSGANLSTINQVLQEVYGADFDLEASLMQYLRDGQVVPLLRTVMETIGSLSQAAISFTILVLLAYALLVHGESILAWAESVVPLPSEDWRSLVERADELMFAIVIGNVAVAIVDGLLVGTGLFLTGFSSVPYWTFVAMLAALVPMVGSTIVWIPAAAYLGVTGSPVAGVLLFLYGGLVIGTVDSFLRPYVGAKQAGLNPVIFIVGAFSGLALLGVMGLFYGPIALVMTKHVFDVLGPGDVD